MEARKGQVRWEMGWEARREERKRKEEEEGGKGGNYGIYRCCRISIINRKFFMSIK
jgi:hypothetical protein